MVRANTSTVQGGSGSSPTSASSHTAPMPKSSTSTSTKGSAAKWNTTDRVLLFNYVEKKGINDWNGAAAAVPGKNAKQCRDQWMWVVLLQAVDGADE